MSRPTAGFARRVSALASRSTAASPSLSFAGPSSLSIRAARPMSTMQRTGKKVMTPIAPFARPFSSTPSRQHGEVVRPEPGTGIKLTFQDSKGNEIKTIEGNEGDDILSLAHEYDVDLEGACEGSVACSTCHVIIDPEHYDKLPEPDDEENDMLDLAFGLEDTSRLGCQVKLTKDLDGMVAKLPSATRNMYVDGAKARTH
ncbi:2Fe-2S ferredoxin-type domain-containing protein [Papiliotrema laurentii]|uniref:2Fe-2S ferredoxin-type domain-containing protein n=1 Tax=Papiliotrema laurentii TaxID=5418 RepID=A0AAD9CVA9_PAPLA|nr:2Fe-2S ferredoxin-type domain-containing protein [Papiliotrema laurentii]